ncbi:MAG: DegT/DnrJ/EryC1/StrS family aminotransferase [Bacteroidetes bacterium]|nr:MAG: DegT/DnrJ/EryC1/StrS family aminotransferase [Bacteroidota bacterium]
MNIPFVDLQAQYASIQAEIDAAIQEVMAHTAFISGRYARKFEAEFAAWLGVEHCVSCGNGTDSLEMLLKVYGVGPGHEVIVPAHSWISTAECVNAVGARPVFVDTHPQHYTILPEKIAERIGPATRAIIPVHLYGLPADMDPIMALAEQHGLVVIEDCAQAHGATYKGRKVGTIGHAASFSFYPGKNLGAYGDAGCMVTQDAHIATEARKLANHGQLVKHEHHFPGRNSRLDGLQAAVLSAKLPHLDQWIARRQEVAAAYTHLLEDAGFVLPQVPADRTHAYHLYVIQTPGRNQLQAELKAQGIATGIHYPAPLPFTGAYKELGYRETDIPNCAAYTPRILSLPIYPELTPEMVSYVTDKLKAKALMAG